MVTLKCVGIFQLNLENFPKFLISAKICQKDAFYALLFVSSGRFGDSYRSTGEREIQSEYGRLPDNPGEFAKLEVAFMVSVLISGSSSLGHCTRHLTLTPCPSPSRSMNG